MSDDGEFFENIFKDDIGKLAEIAAWNPGQRKTATLVLDEVVKFYAWFADSSVRDSAAQWVEYDDVLGHSVDGEKYPALARWLKALPLYTLELATDLPTYTPLLPDLALYTVLLTTPSTIEMARLASENENNLIDCTDAKIMHSFLVEADRSKATQARKRAAPAPGTAKKRTTKTAGKRMHRGVLDEKK